MQAKKRFGQNFLKDTKVLLKIIQSMPKNSSHELVEIGPGLGDLTHELLQIKNVTAYEVDDDLSVLLKKRFKKEILNKQLILQQRDVLKAWNEKGSLHNNFYDIVANLPYYIATSIILHALNDNNCKNMTVMVQKEVAEKFAATAPMREFSSLAILSHLIAKVELLFDVYPTSFEPSPKVISSVIRFQKINTYENVFHTQHEYENFKSYLKHAFSSPRKTLLKNLGTIMPKNELEDIFKDFGFKATIRAHQVDTTTHHHLFNTITKVKINGKTNRKTTK